MNINERFAALTRARRGDKTVIIVDEDVLLALLGDAQASEAAIVGGDWPTRGNRDYELHGRPKPRPPASAGPIVSVTNPPAGLNFVSVLQESIRADRIRASRRPRGW